MSRPAATPRSARAVRANLRTLTALGCLAALAVPRDASAGPTLAVNVEAAAARSVGPTKSDQFGWGGVGVVAPELVLAPSFSLELAAGALGFDGGDGTAPTGVAPTSYGFGGFGTLGVRVRPFAGFDEGDGAFMPSGVWVASGFGAGVTGGATRPAVRVALGYDVATEAMQVGPFAGFFQLVEPDGGSLRPEDARVGLVGIHGSFGRGSTPLAAPTQVDRVAPPREVPPPDSDGDGIPDDRDACVTIAEDRDGHDDLDGCPEDEPAPDGDRDGVPDATDACPAEPETPNGMRDEDGCPDAAELHVDGRSIILGEHLHFGSGGVIVDAQGLRVIAELSSFLKDHPEYARLRVEGHTDDIGPEEFNLALSQKRAVEVIRRLVASGIAPGRLVPQALGESVPVDPSLTPAARRANRRVQLHIEERQPVSAPQESAP